MKISVYGAGAIGAFLGTRLALTGQAQVSTVARGETLHALQQHGWRLREGESLLGAPVHACADPAALGVQDLVIIAVKGPALQSVARSIGPLLDSHTVVLPALNGVPWWFAQTVPALRQTGLESVDPGGVIARHLPIQQVVGCVVHASVARTEPGLVVHKMGRGLIIGEPMSQHAGAAGRLDRLVALFAAAGFEIRTSTKIHDDVWFKLWGNLTINPISAMTGATADLILDDPLVRAFCSAAMLETAAIGARLGCVSTQTPEQRHAMTRRLGAFKTSMLQDAEAGRALELDAIVSVVREIGQRLGVATPNVDALLGLTRLFAKVHGLYPTAG